ncbi:MAG: DUF1697 domain-containing protein [Thermoplasmata archaeon]|jgi:uncharacterized protein (DUF1697 family)
MPLYVALLRAVNLGGSTQVSMSALRDHLTGAGFEDIRTLLQSGNVVFRHRGRNASEIELRLEDTVARAFGRRTEVLVRTPSEWRTVVDRNPFREAAQTDPGHLTVLTLKEAPLAEGWTRLAKSIVGPEQVRAAGREGYVLYPAGIGSSRLTLDRIERNLGTRGTLRNWNTVTKIDALLTK